MEICLVVYLFLLTYKLIISKIYKNAIEIPTLWSINVANSIVYDNAMSIMHTTNVNLIGAIVKKDQI